MNVQVTKIKSGRQIALYPIKLGGDLAGSEAAHFDEAWRYAVEDGVVEASDRDAFVFKLFAD